MFVGGLCWNCLMIIDDDRMMGCCDGVCVGCLKFKRYVIIWKVCIYLLCVFFVW